MCQGIEKAFWGLKLAIWAFFVMVRNCLVDLVWVLQFWKDFFRVDKEGAFLRF